MNKEKFVYTKKDVAPTLIIDKTKNEKEKTENKKPLTTRKE